MKLTNLVLVATAILALSACGIDKSGQGKREGVGTSTFMVSQVKATEVFTSKLSAMGIPEEKLFNIQACIKDRLEASSIVDREFRVWAEGDVKILRTDANGCLMWQERHSFNYLEAETYFAIERTIEGVSGFKGSEKIALKMNPWKDGGSALVDSRYEQVPEETALSGATFKTKLSRVSEKSSALKVKVVSFHLRRYRPDLYKVNKDLSLEVAHEYEFRTNVQFLRQTLNGQSNETPFRGRLLVHGYLTKQPVPVTGEVREIVASFNDEVIINEDGLINHPIVMRIHDPISFSSRSYFYLTFEPLDEPNLGKINVMGLDDPNGPFNVQLRPVDQDIIELFSANRRQVLIAGDMHKNLINNGMVQELQPQSGSKLAKFAEFMADYKATAKNPVSQTELCESVFAGTDKNVVAARERCLCESGKGSVLAKWWSCSGESRYSTLMRDVVIEVQGQPEILTPPVRESMAVSASFDKSQSVNTDMGNKLGANAGVSISGGVSTDIMSLPVNVGLNFGANGEIFWSRVSKSSTNQGSGTSQNSELKYEGESYRIGYRAQVKRCTMFEVKGEGKVTGVRRMVCSPAFDRQVRQTYYFMNMSVLRDSVITDSAAQDSSKHFVVRGKAAYGVLRDVLATKGATIMYDRAQASDLVKPGKLTEEYPGLLLPLGDD